MEKEKADEAHKEVNSCTDTLTSVFVGNSLQWQENITIIDLSARNMASIEDHIKLPSNLVELNLSHNQLNEVPSAVMDLKNLKSLDISYNNISFFDDIPNFHATIEQLNVSHNDLKRLPFWIWSETTDNMKQLNLGFNINITKFMNNEYCDQIVAHKKTSITDVDVHNCKLTLYLKIMSTFPNARTLTVGVKSHYYGTVNRLFQLPCAGLDQCCDIQKLNASNTFIYSIESNIGMYKNLIELDLSVNNLSYIPYEFCNLENLEICLLSCNRLTSLPENIYKLHKLVKLDLDSNQLENLPERFSELQNLERLDMYENMLRELPENMDNIKELDFAQNYFVQPEDEVYIAKKTKLRLNKEPRKDERRIEVIRPESDLDSGSEDEEELEEYLPIDANNELPQLPSGPSSPDWDQDDNWMPIIEPTPAPAPSSWLSYVKQNMETGSFCPMDMNAMSVHDTVKYETVCNPLEFYESDGQFDNDSSDDD